MARGLLWRLLELLGLAPATGRGDEAHECLPFLFDISQLWTRGPRWSGDAAAAATGSRETHAARARRRTGVATNVALVVPGEASSRYRSSSVSLRHAGARLVEIPLQVYCKEQSARAAFDG